MKKNIKWKNLKKLKFIFINLLFLCINNIPKTSKNIVFSIENSSKNQKYWVGGKYEIIINKFLDNSNEKIYLKSSNNKVVELSNRYILMKSNGRECLTVYTRSKKINSRICINIYNTPELVFKEISPIKLEINNMKKLNLDRRDYPKLNVKFNSNHPEVIKVNSEGEITAIRPGNAIITASGLDGVNARIKVLGISTNGFINNYTLNQYNASQFKNVMIVAHPDDETLWGGANLYKERYFVVCLTNGYNLKRAFNFKEILKFTNNSGIILNYPDIQDNIRDDWSEVSIGILKDLSTLLSFKFWDKVVTHGPDGTTGHIHHKKTCEYVTKIAKECNEYKNLYYFGKFYNKNKIPKYLTRISNELLIYKKKEISIYQSVINNIYKFWYHMLPYENWILASKWKELK
jgi:LmbE family N-acetylglucosaminyl deacetylase